MSNNFIIIIIVMNNNIINKGLFSGLLRKSDKEFLIIQLILQFNWTIYVLECYSHSSSHAL